MVIFLKLAVGLPVLAAFFSSVFAAPVVDEQKVIGVSSSALQARQHFSTSDLDCDTVGAYLEPNPCVYAQEHHWTDIIVNGIDCLPYWCSHDASDKVDVQKVIRVPSLTFRTPRYNNGLEYCRQLGSGIPNPCRFYRDQAGRTEYIIDDGFDCLPYWCNVNASDEDDLQEVVSIPSLTLEARGHIGWNTTDVLDPVALCEEMVIGTSNATFCAKLQDEDVYDLTIDGFDCSDYLCNGVPAADCWNEGNDDIMALAARDSNDYTLTYLTSVATTITEYSSSASSAFTATITTTVLVPTTSTHMATSTMLVQPLLPSTITATATVLTTVVQPSTITAAPTMPTIGNDEAGFSNCLSHASKEMLDCADHHKNPVKFSTCMCKEAQKGIDSCFSPRTGLSWQDDFYYGNKDYCSAGNTVLVGPAITTETTIISSPSTTTEQIKTKVTFSVEAVSTIVTPFIEVLDQYGNIISKTNGASTIGLPLLGGSMVLVAALIGLVAL